MIAAMVNVIQMKKVLLLALISWLLVACQEDVVFTEFKSLPSQGWMADLSVIFMPTIVDAMPSYDVQLVVRHTDRYAYQNLWFFVDVQKDSVVLRRDTIESFLADDRGNWLGSGVHIYKLPLLYLDNIVLPDSGTYDIVLHQGMREDTLQGLVDVGIKVIKQK